MEVVVQAFYFRSTFLCRNSDIGIHYDIGNTGFPFSPALPLIMIVMGIQLI